MILVCCLIFSKSSSISCVLFEKSLLVLHLHKCGKKTAGRKVSLYTWLGGLFYSSLETLSSGQMESYFTNLDFPEIAGDFPSKTLPFWGRVRSCDVAVI